MGKGRGVLQSITRTSIHQDNRGGIKVRAWVGKVGVIGREGGDGEGVVSGLSPITL